MAESVVKVAVDWEAAGSEAAGSAAVVDLAGAGWVAEEAGLAVAAAAAKAVVGTEVAWAAGLVAEVMAEEGRAAAKAAAVTAEEGWEVAAPAVVAVTVVRSGATFIPDDVDKQTL